jgi:hypothetical protein
MNTLQTIGGQDESNIVFTRISWHGTKNVETCILTT